MGHPFDDRVQFENDPRWICYDIQSISQIVGVEVAPKIVESCRRQPSLPTM